MLPAAVASADPADPTYSITVAPPSIDLVEGDEGDVYKRQALILLGGVHLAAVILLGDIVVIECPPAAVRLGKDDIAQFPARVADVYKRQNISCFLNDSTAFSAN